MDSLEKKLVQEYMNQLILDIVGMLLIDYQIIYYSNCKGIQIIMKIHINHTKHYVLMKKVLVYLMDIQYVSY